MVYFSHCGLQPRYLDNLLTLNRHYMDKYFYWTYTHGNLAQQCDQGHKQED